MKTNVVPVSKNLHFRLMLISRKKIKVKNNEVLVWNKIQDFVCVHWCVELVLMLVLVYQCWKQTDFFQSSNSLSSWWSLVLDLYQFIFSSHCKYFQTIDWYINVDIKLILGKIIPWKNNTRPIWYLIWVYMSISHTRSRPIYQSNTCQD